MIDPFIALPHDFIPMFSPIQLGTVQLPFGKVCVGVKRNQVFILTFQPASAVRRKLKSPHPLTPLTRPFLKRIQDVLLGKKSYPWKGLQLQGTAFQIRVWRELMNIPRGSTRSYGEIAKKVGCPGGARAVGSACGKNPVALLVPCHRVLGSGGSMGGFAWGLSLKEKILKSEGFFKNHISRQSVKKEQRKAR